MNKYISYKTNNNGICLLKISRAPVNALSFNLLHDLNKVLLKLNEDDKIRCLLIYTDNKHFSAGADLKERKIMSKNQASDALNIFNECFNNLENFKTPVICVINGFCLGGGAELALSCDIRIGSNDSIVGFPEVSIGIIPGAGGTQRLSNVIGFSNSKYWILTAKKFTAIEAEKFGFLNFVVNKNNLLNYSISIAEEIINNAPIAIKSAKLAINQGLQLNSLKEKLNIERKHYATCLNSKDRLEALDAFNNKRKPKWENK